MMILRFRNYILTMAVIGFYILPSAAASTELMMPKIFGDHMVLQSDQPAPVWGWGKPGETVTVSFAGQTKTVTAGKDGYWLVRLDPLAVSIEPRELTVVGAKTLKFVDVLVGEVWFCSGQSNMEKPLGDQRGQKPILNFERELAAAKFPQLRLLKVKISRDSKPARDIRGGAWVQCGPDTLDKVKFSAAGYFFGRKIHLDAKVPVGMIDASMGGSRIELWIPPEGFEAMPSLHEFAKVCRQPGAKVHGSTLSNSYNGMVCPITPFAIRGILWYQGESNIYAGDKEIYRDKMTTLINSWRKAWKRELPFYYVQIAPLLYHVTRSHYVVSPEATPQFWEAQEACLNLPRTGMVVTTDLVDDLNDIHPRNKKPVGERLALLALAKDYGQKDTVFSGPVFSKMVVKGDKAIIHFDHLGGGLMCKGNRPLNWFVIGGPNGELFPGIAMIEGETVIITSPKVKHPTIVRFAWDEAARPNFFNKAGLPAMPFRTDNPFRKEIK